MLRPCNCTCIRIRRHRPPQGAAAAPLPPHPPPASSQHLSRPGAGPDDGYSCPDDGWVWLNSLYVCLNGSPSRGGTSRGGGHSSCGPGTWLGTCRGWRIEVEFSSYYARPDKASSPGTASARATHLQRASASGLRQPRGGRLGCRVSRFRYESKHG